MITGILHRRIGHIRHKTCMLALRHLGCYPTAKCLLCFPKMIEPLIVFVEHNKRDDFDFEIVNFSFFDGDVPRSTSYGVYISQIIRFARASSYVADFNTRNKLLTQKLLKQGYRYHKLRKTFSNFYRRYYDLISKFQIGLRSLLCQGLSQPDFYGDLVYKIDEDCWV